MMAEKLKTKKLEELLEVNNQLLKMNNSILKANQELMIEHNRLLIHLDDKLRRLIVNTSTLR